MMLEHCGQLERGRRLREAILATLAVPATRTVDLGGPLGTRAFAAAVIANL